MNQTKPEMNLLVRCMLLTGLAVPGPAALAAPSGGTVQQGDASISQTGSHTQINQSTQAAEIDWDSFDLSADESVTFSVPGSQSYTLNQIHSANPSVIHGQVTSNGTVILANPNGLFFGAQSRVDVHSLIGTTATVSMSGNTLSLSASDTGAGIVHQGQIQADSSVALYAPALDVSGSVEAHDIRLSNHSSGVITLLESGIGYAVDDAADARLRQQGIDLSGELVSDGGYIEITSAAQDTLANSAVNVTGLASANSLIADGGTLSLVAEEGTVWVSGSLQANSVSQQGGSIEINAERIALVDEAEVSANGLGGGGSVRIGLGREQALARASQVYLGEGTLVEASATGTGAGGRIDVWSEDQTQVYGTLKAEGRGTGESGGFIETSSVNQLLVDAEVSVTSPDGPAGEWLLDPGDIRITNPLFGINDNIIEDPSGIFNSLDNTADSILTIGSLESALQANNNVRVESTGVDSDIYLELDNIFNPNRTLNLGVASPNSSLTLDAVNNIYLRSDITNGLANLFTLTLDAGNTVYMQNSQIQVNSLNLLANQIVSGPTALDIEATNITTQDGLSWQGFSDLSFSGANSRLESTAPDRSGTLSFDMNGNNLTLGSIGQLGNGMGELTLTEVDLLSLRDTLNTRKALDLLSGVGSISLLNSLSLETGGEAILLADVAGNNNILTLPSASSANQDITLNDLSNLGSLSLDTEGRVTLNSSDIQVNGTLDIIASEIQLGGNNRIEAGGYVDIAAPIEGDVGGTSDLTLIAGAGGSGTLQLGTIGANLSLSDLTLQAADALFVGPQIAVDTIGVTASQMTVEDDFTLSATGLAALNGTAITSAGQESVTLNAGQVTGLGNVEVGRFSVNANTLTLNGSLTAETGGIDLSGVGALSLLGDSELTALATGDLTLTDNIAGNFHLTLSIDAGDLSLGTQSAVSSLASLTANDTNTALGTNRVGQQVRTQGDLTFNELGSLHADSGLALVSNTGSVTLANTALEVANSQALSVQAANGTVSLGDVNAGSATVVAAETRLDGDVAVQGALDFSQASSIVLDGDSRLTGQLTFGSLADAVAINSAAGAPAAQLSLDALGQDLVLYDVGATDALSAFSLVNVGTLRLTQPLVTSGSGGVSLAGGQWLLEQDYRIDTAVANGLIDIQGIAIDGPHTLTLNAGNGRVSLGDIGQSSVLTSLLLERVSALELGGDITTEDAALDFSMAQTLELVDDTHLDVSAQDGSINLGSGAINGTFDLHLSSGAGSIQMGSAGQTVALQSLTIDTTSDLVMDDAVSVVDELRLSALSLGLNADAESSGGQVHMTGTEGIAMAAGARLTGYQGVNLTADTGDVRLARVESGQGDIQVTATEGSILNGIGDFVNIGDTSVNLTAENVDLTAGSGIGKSPVDPVVLDVAQQGQINLSLGEPYAYIVNINGTAVNVVGGEVFDTLQESQQAASQQSGQLQQDFRPAAFGDVQITNAENADNPLYAVTQPGFVIPSNVLLAFDELSDNRPAVPALRWLDGRWQLQYPVGAGQ